MTDDSISSMVTKPLRSEKILTLNLLLGKFILKSRNPQDKKFALVATG